MPNRFHGALALGLLLALAPASFAAAGGGSPAPTPKETPMTRHATGPFDVTVKPQPLSGPVEDATLGRMSIEKTYHGDLEATAHGQMLTAGTGVEGSGAYVAMERVSGTLHGKTGSFALQHLGVMTRGEPHLEIRIVPDSGTGELTGIAGTLDITIAEGGKHSYDLAYTLPGPQ